MSVDSVNRNPNLEGLYYEEPTRTPVKEMGKNQFIELLVAQLSNQDPLNPATDTEFIAQMAQFSALEQMTNLNTNFAVSQAYDMVGKYIRAEIPGTVMGTTELFSGRVDSVVIRNGVPYLVSGELMISPSTVFQIFTGDSLNGGSEAALRGSALIGKTVTFDHTYDVESVNDEGETVTEAVTESATGIVNKISIDGAFVKVHVTMGSGQEHTIMLDEIKAIEA